MPFILMGFDQSAGVRRYAFQGIVEGVRTAFTVKVELALITQYGIRIQDLPLLCRALLERQDENTPKRSFILGEDAMRDRAESSDSPQRKKPARKPATENAGSAWRAPFI